ncbi:MAG TPA: LysM domain-containing protein [Acidimicrobiia bacterium]
MPSLQRPMVWCALAVGGAIVLAGCDRSAQSSDRSEPAAASTTVGSTTTTTTPPITYEVKSGDTLTAIAGLFGVTSEAIAEANQLANADQLTEGQILQIPERPLVTLAVLPTVARAGTEVRFALTGAQAGEAITLQINGPGGTQFTGSPHVASPEGTLMTSYRTTGDVPGTYTVVATGSQGTLAQTSYDLYE